MRESIIPSPSQNPRVLAAAALRRVDHQRSALKRDARQPARNDRHLLAIVEAIGAQIDVPRAHGADRGIERRHA